MITFAGRARPTAARVRGGNAMTEQEYIEQRLDQQQKWFSAKSAQNQTAYKRWRVLEIVLAASIPFLTSMINAGWPRMTYVVGFFGFLIAAVSGLLALNRYHDHWIEYRAAGEALKREKFLFLTRAPPYDGANAFAALVERVEALLSRENAAWAGHSKQQAQSAPSPGSARSE
jgi:hypothetical protein